MLQDDQQPFALRLFVYITDFISPMIEHYCSVHVDESVKNLKHPLMTLIIMTSGSDKKASEVLLLPTQTQWGKNEQSAELKF